MRIYFLTYLKNGIVFSSSRAELDSDNDPSSLDETLRLLDLAAIVQVSIASVLCLDSRFQIVVAVFSPSVMGEDMR
jgi:hypothetical protein